MSDKGIQEDGTRGAPIGGTSRPGTPASLSLVLPMFNEADSVEHTLEQALRNLEPRFSDFEIVIIDDGSTDGCGAKVQQWAERDPRIVFYRLERNSRFGGALRKGLALATKEFLLYTDFDLPVPLDFLPRVLAELQHAEVVTAYSPAIPKNLSWNTRLISRTYNLIVRSVFGLQLKDINFGLKAMRKSTADLLELRSCSPFVDAELFVQARRLGCRIAEIAVPFSPRLKGISRIRRPDVIAWTFLDMGRFFFHPRPKRKSAARQESPSAPSQSQGRIAPPPHLENRLASHAAAGGEESRLK